MTMIMPLNPKSVYFFDERWLFSTQNSQLLPFPDDVQREIKFREDAEKAVEKMNDSWKGGGKEVAGT